MMYFADDGIIDDENGTNFATVYGSIPENTNECSKALGTIQDWPNPDDIISLLRIPSF